MKKAIHHDVPVKKTPEAQKSYSDDPYRIPFLLEQVQKGTVNGCTDLGIINGNTGKIAPSIFAQNKRLSRQFLK